MEQCGRVEETVEGGTEGRWKAGTAENGMVKCGVANTGESAMWNGVEWKEGSSLVFQGRTECLAASERVQVST